MALELLEGRLKIKIEFNWCDIIAFMRAIFPSDNGYLSIEVVAYKFVQIA